MAHLLRRFPDADRDLRWEQIRLLGEFKVSQGFASLLKELEIEPDPVAQFHLAQALASLSSGWTAEEERRAVNWLLGTQRGWFADFSGKGVEFPEFWATVLTQFGAHHREALLRPNAPIDFTGLLGNVVLNLMAEPPSADERLIVLYQTNRNLQIRARILGALKQVRSPKVDEFLQTEHDRLDWNVPADATLGGGILQNWAAHPTAETFAYLIYEGLFHDDPQVVRACAGSLAKDAARIRSLVEARREGKKSGAAQADLANDLISRMVERPEVWRDLERVLVIWSGQRRPDFQPDAHLSRRPEDATRTAAVAFWQRWYEERFHQQFKPLVEKSAGEKTDAEVRQFLLSDAARGGDAQRGSKVYQALQCQTCHGGGVTPGNEGRRLFGPDLAGVTRRLTRAELADAMVYPSEQIADRFKAVEIRLKDATALTGFLTEQTAESLTLVDREQVHRIPRSTIQSLLPLSTSLMPERLLNRLSWEEMKDLLAFLDEAGAGVQPGGRSPPQRP
ncbi:MAG TPA: c-type cytochrome, partial [Candidatus Binatia bacterium]|nr:c-type cytochrome [Candidatus Binatia bacterium]